MPVCFAKRRNSMGLMPCRLWPAPKSSAWVRASTSLRRMGRRSRARRSTWPVLIARKSACHRHGPRSAARSRGGFFPVYAVAAMPPAPDSAARVWSASMSLLSQDTSRTSSGDDARSGRSWRFRVVTWGPLRNLTMPKGSPPRLKLAAVGSVRAAAQKRSHRMVLMAMPIGGRRKANGLRLLFECEAVHAVGMLSSG